MVEIAIIVIAIALLPFAVAVAFLTLAVTAVIAFYVVVGIALVGFIVLFLNHPRLAAALVVFMLVWLTLALAAGALLWICRRLARRHGWPVTRVRWLAGAAYLVGAYAVGRSLDSGYAVLMLFAGALAYGGWRLLEHTRDEWDYRRGPAIEGALSANSGGQEHMSE